MSEDRKADIVMAICFIVFTILTWISLKDY